MWARRLLLPHAGSIGLGRFSVRPFLASELSTQAKGGAQNAKLDSFTSFFPIGRTQREGNGAFLSRMTSLLRHPELNLYVRLIWMYENLSRPNLGKHSAAKDTESFIQRWVDEPDMNRSIPSWSSEDIAISIRSFSILFSFTLTSKKSESVAHFLKAWESRAAQVVGDVDATSVAWILAGLAKAKYAVSKEFLEAYFNRAKDIGLENFPVRDLSKVVYAAQSLSHYGTFEVSDETWDELTKLVLQTLKNSRETCPLDGLLQIGDVVFDATSCRLKDPPEVQEAWTGAIEKHLEMIDGRTLERVGGILNGFDSSKPSDSFLERIDKAFWRTHQDLEVLKNVQILGYLAKHGHEASKELQEVLEKRGVSLNEAVKRKPQSTGIVRECRRLKRSMPLNTPDSWFDQVDALYNRADCTQESLILILDVYDQTNRSRRRLEPTKTRTRSFLSRWMADDRLLSAISRFDGESCTLIVRKMSFMAVDVEFDPMDPGLLKLLATIQGRLQEVDDTITGTEYARLGSAFAMFSSPSAEFVNWWAEKLTASGIDQLGVDELCHVAHAAAQWKRIENVSIPENFWSALDSSIEEKYETFSGAKLVYLGECLTDSEGDPLTELPKSKKGFLDRVEESIHEYMPEQFELLTKILEKSEFEGDTEPLRDKIQLVSNVLSKQSERAKQWHPKP